MDTTKIKIAFDLRNATTREKADQLIKWGADPTMFAEHTGGALTCGAAGAFAGFRALVNEGCKIFDDDQDSDGYKSMEF